MVSLSPPPPFALPPCLWRISLDKQHEYLQCDEYKHDKPLPDCKALAVISGKVEKRISRDFFMGLRSRYGWRWKVYRAIFNCRCFILGVVFFVLLFYLCLLSFLCLILSDSITIFLFFNVLTEASANQAVWKGPCCVDQVGKKLYTFPSFNFWFTSFIFLFHIITSPQSSFSSLAQITSLFFFHFLSLHLLLTIIRCGHTVVGIKLPKQEFVF